MPNTLILEIALGVNNKNDSKYIPKTGRRLIFIPTVKPHTTLVIIKFLEVGFSSYLKKKRMESRIQNTTAISYLK